MAVIYCEEIGNGRSGDWSLGDMRREYTRTFLVQTDDPFDSQIVVLSADLGPANRVPYFGEPYAAGGDVDLGALCHRRRATQPEPVDDPTLWEVVATYTSRSSDPALQSGQAGGGGGGGTPQASHPLYAPPQIGWGIRMMPRPVYRDTDGEPIANTAGTPFDPPLTIEVPCRTLTIVRNELPPWDPFDAAEYVGKLNLAPFQGRPDGTALCENISGAYQFQDGIAYFSVSYEFMFSPPGDEEEEFFLAKFVNRGPEVKVSGPVPPGDPPLRKQATDGYGQARRTVNLAVDGTELADGDPIVTISFEVRAYADFDALNLPDPAY